MFELRKYKMFKPIVISTLILSSLAFILPKVYSQELISEDFQIMFDRAAEFSLQSHNIYNQYLNFKWDTIVEVDENFRPLNQGNKLGFNKKLNIDGYNEIVDVERKVTSSTVRWSVSEPSYDVFIDNSIYSDTVEVDYANTTIRVPAGCLKFSITIPRWRFSNDAYALMLKIVLTHSDNKKNFYHNKTFSFDNRLDNAKTWAYFEEMQNDKYEKVLKTLEMKWKRLIAKYNNMTVCLDKVADIANNIIMQLKYDIEYDNVNTFSVYVKLIEDIKRTVSTVNCHHNISISSLPFSPIDDIDEMILYNEYLNKLSNDNQDVEGDRNDDLRPIRDFVKRGEWGNNGFVDFPNRIVVDGEIVKTIVKKSGNTVRIIIPRFDRYAYYDPVAGIEDKIVSSSNANSKYIDYDLVYLAICIALMILL
jgi:hypothetical protein